MPEEGPRLLFSDDPYPDESLIGYLLRLAEMNAVPTIRWIVKLIKPTKYQDHNYSHSFDSKLNISSLSTITGTDEIKLRELKYLKSYTNHNNIRSYLIVFGQEIKRDLVNRERPKICPLCISEDNYCRKVWELSFITACPIHRCLLLGHCPACQLRLNWERPKISLCRCQYDFRETKVALLKDEDLRLTNYFYHAFDLPRGGSKPTLSYPLNKLKPAKLLKLLYFMLAYYTDKFEYSDYRVPHDVTIKQLHKYLTLAVEVFDNWAANYHEFIDAWSEKYKGYYSSYRESYSSRFILPVAYYDYESFNYILRCYLTKKNYPFLHEEFINFLKALPVVNDEEVYLLDYL